jgi:hypothetical protein
MPKKLLLHRIRAKAVLDTIDLNLSQCLVVYTPRQRQQQ